MAGINSHNPQTIVGPTVISVSQTNLVNQGLSGSQPWPVNVVSGSVGGGIVFSGSVSGSVTVAGVEPVTGTLILGQAFTALQGTIPWQVTGSVGLTSAPTVLQGTTPWQTTGSVGLAAPFTVFQGTTPWQMTGSVGLTTALTIFQGTTPWNVQGAYVSGSTSSDLGLDFQPFLVAGTVLGSDQIAPIMTDKHGSIMVIGNDASVSVLTTPPLLSAGVSATGTFRLAQLAVDQAGRYLTAGGVSLYSGSFVGNNSAVTPFDTGPISTRGCSTVVFMGWTDVTNLTTFAYGVYAADGSKMTLSTPTFGTSQLGNFFFGPFRNTSGNPIAPAGGANNWTPWLLPPYVGLSGTIPKLSSNPAFNFYAMGWR